MERNLKLTIAYDGTEFHGWQRQPNLRTVQGELETVARRVIRQPLEIVGASRTDRGVHARGQVAHLRTATTIPTEKLRRAIGERLPADLALVAAQDVPLEFHATRDALGKLYRYWICNDVRRPVEWAAQRYAWHVWQPLDASRMQAAADLLVGTHDFAAFAGSGGARESTVRTIHRAQIRRRFNALLIDFAGDGFLYNQVRNMVGTLVEVGRGHWAPERVAEILACRDRRQAGPTAPAHGLFLEWVRYPPLRDPGHADQDHEA